MSLLVRSSLPLFSLWSLILGTRTLGLTLPWIITLTLGCTRPACTWPAQGRRSSQPPPSSFFFSHCLLSFYKCHVGHSHQDRPHRLIGHQEGLYKKIESVGPQGL
ncbi:hypothetical protein O6H91_Y008100 [Diphasiastrum complanatum]|nr:hypothetical protein O6H91_Y008100 [Diphasiastrum complanatum]